MCNLIILSENPLEFNLDDMQWLRNVGVAKLNHLGFRNYHFHGLSQDHDFMVHQKAPESVKGTRHHQNLMIMVISKGLFNDHFLLKKIKIHI